MEIMVKYFLLSRDRGNDWEIKLCRVGITQAVRD